MKSFIHDKAIVETTNIGENTTIWAFSHVMSKAKIGSEVNIGEQCFIENNVSVGDRVTIKNGVSLWDGIWIEDNVFIGPSVAFTNDLFPRSKNHSYELKRTLLKKGCSIGANATILPGITIGTYVMVGAGSVITKNIPDYALVYGNPAVIHGYVCECGERLKSEGDKITCLCGNVFREENDKVEKVI